MRLIYASVDNNAYSFAFSIIKQYGICNANSGKISELARHMLGFAGTEDDDELTQLCEYAFENKNIMLIFLKILKKDLMELMSRCLIYGMHAKIMMYLQVI